MIPFHDSFKPVYFLLLIVWSFSGCVKDEPENVKFSLPSNIINKIVTDINGTKWIATDKGLVCLNGELNPYSELQGSYKQKYADLVFNPSNGKELWIAGNAGVDFLTFNNGNIINSGSYKSQENGLLSDEISAVALDNQETKFFGTSLGLSILKNDQWKVFLGRTSEEILREYKISSIATAKNGWIYAATLGGGVSRFKYTDAVSGATTFDSVWSQLKSNYINTVVIVDDTCQWYGTNKGAAFHTSQHTKVKSDWKIYTKNEGLISDTVLSIAKDQSGKIWFGTNNGASSYDGVSFTSYTIADGLTGNKINTISVDIDGSLWFGTDNGISHFKDGKWTNITVK